MGECTALLDAITGAYMDASQADVGEVQITAKYRAWYGLYWKSEQIYSPHNETFGQFPFAGDKRERFNCVQPN